MLMEMRPKAHSESTVVRNSERFRDMDSTHGAWRLDEKIGPLACLPRRLQKVVEPAPELKSASATREKTMTHLLQTLFEERHGEHTVVDAHLHQLGWVSAHAGELDAVLLISSILRY